MDYMFVSLEECDHYIILERDLFEVILNEDSSNEWNLFSNLLKDVHELLAREVVLEEHYVLTDHCLVINSSIN